MGISLRTELFAPRNVPLTALPDDFARVGEPDWHDAPTVKLEQAVNSVINVLTGEADLAFGENLDWWLDVIADSVAGNQRSFFLALLAPATFPTFPRYVALELSQHIHRTANELLAEMDAGDIERHDLSQ